MNERMRKACCIVIGGVLIVLPPSFAHAAEPGVKGPESVRDWWTAGQQFIAKGKQLQPNGRKARNVILFVGDGMGLSTMTAARILDGQLNGRPGEENRLSFEELPYVALSKTYSWDQQTPDSAPTMTAMVTGYKARESMLSVDHTTSRYECDPAVIAAKSLATILEQAAGAGMSTGVVTTTRVTHATPAANYAHTAVRDWESDAELRAYESRSGMPAGACEVKDIARQLIEQLDAVRQSLKVVLGGGRTYFLPREATDPEYGTTKGRRLDKRDLTVEWVTTRGPGATFVWNKAQFDAVNPASTGFLLGLFEPSHMQYEADRASDVSGEPSLTDMTEKALQVLAANDRGPRRRGKGFYLQVEGGRIDHAHHAGNPYRALTDTIEFAKAIRKAYEMTNPEETLILVTADHSHVLTIAGYPHRGNPILGKVAEVPDTDGTAPEPSKDLLGLPYTTLSYANGPGYTGASYTNRNKTTVLQPAGIKTFPHNPAGVDSGAVRPDLTGVDSTARNFMPEATVPLSSETHAGEDVAVYASGPRSHLVRGSMEQNWIYHVMREALGL